MSARRNLSRALPSGFRPEQAEARVGACNGTRRRSEAVWHVSGVHAEHERGCEPEVEHADQ